MYCRHCGHENSEGYAVCANCGRPLGAAEDAETGILPAHEGHAPAPTREEQANAPGADAQDMVAALEPGTALLFAVRGPNQGARFLLDREQTTVGRHPDSDIFLDDITVSRRHAELRREGGRFHVRDAGSLNGSYVNGERVEDRAVESGDEVQIGKFKLVAYIAPGGT